MLIAVATFWALVAGLGWWLVRRLRRELAAERVRAEGLEKQLRGVNKALDSTKRTLAAERRAWARLSRPGGGL